MLISSKLSKTLVPQLALVKTLANEPFPLSRSDVPIWAFLPLGVEYLGEMIELTEASYFQEQSIVFVVGISQI